MSRPPGVTIDLRAAQHPSYRGRGVARYAMDLTIALAAGHRDVLERIVVSPDFPAPQGIEALTGSGLLTTSLDWPEVGGCFHVMAPFDPDSRCSELWPAVASARRMSLVVTVYDLIPDAMPGTYLTDPGKRRRYRARRQLLRAADQVLAISATTGRDVERFAGVEPRRVSVIGAACGPQFARPGSVPAAQQQARSAVHGLGPSWVLYNGAVEPRKNTETLIECYAALPAALRDRCQLVVACALRPLERNHFEVRARQLGIEGRLVLPGYVDDQTLVALNQAARLVVFPSRYEGYGLPVAEALACGAPVIASGNSALAELVAPEATFDPEDPAAITAALQRGLTDEPFRLRLGAWAERPQPTWADVAQRTAAAYRNLLRPMAPARPRIALVTPWPPQRTGVADYSSQLATALGATAAVDVFVDGDDPPPGNLKLRPRMLRRAARYQGGYDAEVVALGNSEFHAGGLRLVRSEHWPWVVLAHDVRLTGLYRHSVSRGAVPEGFGAALSAMYPGCETVMEDGWVPPPVAARHGIFMARELIARAGVFATTSAYAAGLARLDASPGEAGKVTVLPYAYPSVVPRVAGDEEPDLVCSFGIVNASKQPGLLIDAIALLPASPNPVRVAFVGPTADEERRTILAHAERRHVPVEVVGYTSTDEYEHWIRRAALAVQLRQTTNGETSGAVADCLVRGIPTIVSDLGAAQELPAAVAKLPPGADPGQLAALIAPLLADPALRARRGAEAQEWAGRRGFDRAAQDLLKLVSGPRLHPVSGSIR